MIRPALSLAFAFAAVTSSAAYAQDLPGTPHTTPAPFAAPTIDEAGLQAVAGREDTAQIAKSEQVAGVSNNSVGNNVATGDARIDGNAFQNLSGLSILNVNTGNNVAINAAMNVTISVTPGQ